MRDLSLERLKRCFSEDSLHILTSRLVPRKSPKKIRKNPEGIQEPDAHACCWVPPPFSFPNYSVRFTSVAVVAALVVTVNECGASFLQALFL